MGVTLKKHCLVCKKEFKVYPSWLKIGRGNCCSIICYSQSGRINQTGLQKEHGWNKGYGDYIKGEKNGRFGKPVSVETRNKISQATNKNRKQIQVCQTCKKRFLAYKIRKYCNLNCRIITKKNNPNWKGGISTQYHLDRTSEKYKLWRQKVFKRDHYTCIFCGDNKGGNLVADHIKPFSFFPELRFDIDNGRTLCTICHTKLPTSRAGSKIKEVYARFA